MYSILTKLAIALDASDVPAYRKLIDAVPGKPFECYRETPDNTYCCFYWDYAEKFSEELQALREELKGVRHALVEIDEEGRITEDIAVSDSYGCDEEFYNLLRWSADICWWEEDTPLEAGRYVPISRSRLLELFTAYVENDSEAVETAYLYDALGFAGCDDEEIKALGFGYCIPEDDAEAVKEE